MWSLLRSTIAEDIFCGCLIMISTISALLVLNWLADEILYGDNPDIFERDQPNNEQQQDVLLPQIPEENPVEEVRCFFYFVNGLWQ